MSDRSTESGIILPDADLGTPVVILHLDRPGLSISLAGPDDDDLDSWANLIAGEQRENARGILSGVHVARDPVQGKPVYLMPAVIGRVLYVCRGFTRQVDPSAMLGAPRVVRAHPGMVPKVPGGQN